MESLAKRIEELRAVEGLTQDELALKAGVSRSTIQAAERHDRIDRVHAKSLRRIAEVFGLSLRELMSGEVMPYRFPRPVYDGLAAKAKARQVTFDEYLAQLAGVVPRSGMPDPDANTQPELDPSQNGPGQPRRRQPGEPGPEPRAGLPSKSGRGGKS